MKPITEYHDYRTYMRDFYEERKRVSYFTWRKFASLAGFVSPTYLKLVCDGKTKLSKPGIEKVARAMGLEGFDYTYFGLLVKFENAKNAVEKEAVLRELEREARLFKVRIVDADAFRYFENPACPIVRELAPIMPEADPGEIAACIRSKTTALDVREVLQFLVKAGFLLKTDKGTYEQTEKSVKGSKEAIPLAMRSMNREMAKLGVNAIDTDKVEERNYSGVTMGIDEAAYARIVEEIDACRKKVVDIARECQNINQVYRLNLQLFPLTDKVGERCKNKGDGQ
jgi:uncharacterized protein (TIGR02147 family)